MEKKKTPIAQKELKTTPKRVDALLFLIINLAITSLWWFVNHISRWSGEGLLNLIVVPLALGIIIAMFEIFFVSRLKFGNTLVKFQVFTGLIGQMIGDWLIYSSIHSIGPSIFRLEHPTYQNSTLWLANDVKIWYFMGVWFIFTFVFLLPGAITLLIRLKRPNTETKGNEEKKDIIRSWHLAMILLGILLGLRIGSSWSMPFFHLLYTALIFPFALSTIQSVELRSK